MCFYFKTRIYRYKVGRVYSLLMDVNVLTRLNDQRLIHYTKTCPVSAMLPPLIILKNTAN